MKLIKTIKYYNIIIFKIINFLLLLKLNIKNNYNILKKKIKYK